VNDERRGRILVVDDDDDIRLLVGTILTRAGYTLLQTASGRGGLEIAGHESLDLILLDLHVPDLDAWTFLVRAWEDKRVKKVPVVMFTASDDEVVAARARAWGCRDFLRKPFTPDQLLQVVEGAMSPAPS